MNILAIETTGAEASVAVINEKGEVIKITTRNTATAISASVTLNNDLTFYVRHGDFLGWISAVLAGMIVLFLLGRKVLGDQTIYN
jgi:apolipoprotein N-acyltransferase